MAVGGSREEIIRPARKPGGERQRREAEERGRGERKNRDGGITTKKTGYVSWAWMVRKQKGENAQQEKVTME
jgi:hypothetical protein